MIKFSLCSEKATLQYLVFFFPPSENENVVHNFYSSAALWEKCVSAAVHFICVCVPDVFSQVSDSSGVMVLSKFDHFLLEALKLPCAVQERPSFGYTNNIVHSCFPHQVKGTSALHLLQSVRVR